MNDPQPNLFQSLQQSAQQHGLLFFYKGIFSSEVVKAATESFRGTLSERNAAPALQRRIFSTFVEMTQNVLHYAAPEVIDGEEHIVGMIAVGAEGNRFWVLCGNRVKSEHVPRLIEKLNAVRNMSSEQIRAAYKDQLRNDQHSQEDEISKGAGLGLLTIARDSATPIEYSLETHHASSQDSTLFELRSTIEISPAPRV